ncbi:GvpL/GvpF family gas vesicle protein [Solidesulfovibrio sp. C21]|uniref:GvpL/GvpF family gas vesicle protein n=1 Tax=Solidesulfovibrio sp. C21 TaxID=3398613 RepID=UPI0039FC7D80
MSWLIYCILACQQPKKLLAPAGVDGKPVRFVGDNGLYAVISQFVPPALQPPIEQLHAYAHVVAALHAQCPVIPLRYGCVAQEMPQVMQKIAERHEEYGILLGELADCVELGIRMQPPSGEASAAAIAAPACPGTTGTDFLRHRAEHYAREAQWRHACEQMITRCGQALDGWWVKSANDPPNPLSPWVSVYFLVRRNGVAAFQQAFEVYRSKESAKMLLTGPWPPYNFVTSACHSTTPGSRLIKQGWRIGHGV